MKSKIILIPLATLSILSLNSCSNVNPNQLFIDEATQAYQSLRTNLAIPENEDYYAWYFNQELLKGCAFRNLNDFTYLGMLNVQTFGFSETNDQYYLEIPNFDVQINLETGEFVLPDFIDTNNPAKIVKQMPFVLVTQDSENGNNEVYSKFNSDGSLDEYAVKENFDPTLFYIADFKLDINVEGVPSELTNEFNIDYTGKNMALLKRDLYTILSQILTPFDFGGAFSIDIYQTLLKNYKKSNDLSANEEIKKNIKYPGHFNGKSVVVGPNGIFDYILDDLIMNIKNVDSLEEHFTSYYHEAESVVFEEGVEEISIFAFEGNNNITSIEIPSSIKKISLSSFSGLSSLANLYIPDTENEIDIFNTYGMSLTIDNPLDQGETPKKIEIKGPFTGSNLSNSLTFEHYDNKNAANFPYEDFVISDGSSIYQKVSFINSKEQIQVSSISEGFDTLDSINPMFMMDISNPIISDERFTLLDAGKTLYLAHNKTKANDELFGLNAENYREYSGVSGAGNLKLTLKLLNNLTIKGNLVVGGVVGKNDTGEGTVVGNYSCIDLNGYSISVENGGILDCNGKIIDTSSSHSGKIIVNDGGQLKINYVLKGNKDYSSYNIQYLNNDFPYDSFSFADCLVPISMIGKSILFAKQILVSSGVDILHNSIIYYGENGVYSADSSDAKMEISYIGDTSLYDVYGSMSFNAIEFAISTKKSPAYSNKMFTPLVSLSHYLRIFGNFTTKTQTKLMNGGVLTVQEGGTLNIESNFISYPQKDTESAATIYLYGKLMISTTADLNVGGTFTLANSKIQNEVISELNKTNVKPSCNNSEGAVEDNKYIVKTNYESYLYCVDTNNVVKYYRFTDGYYYLYSNNSTIYATEDNSILASKENDSNWLANIGSASIDTGVNSYIINSFSTLTNNYVLSNEGAWQEYSAEKPNHTYDVNGKTYIKVQSGSEEKLIAGDFLNEEKLLFKTSSDSKIYHYYASLNKWVYVHLFEHDYILAIPNNASLSANVPYDSSNYSVIYILDTTEKVIESYDPLTHLIKENSTSYYIVYQTSFVGEGSFELANTKGEISARGLIKSLDLSYDYAFISDKGNWVKINSSMQYDCYFDSSVTNYSFAYTSSNKWERAQLFNDPTYTLGYVFVQLLDSTDIERNFALIEENADFAAIITKRGGVELSSEQLNNAGLSSLLPSDKSNYIGYRYFSKNGEYYIFTMDEEENISITKLDAEPSLESYNAETDGDLTARKLISLIKITVRYTQYYVDFNKVIASGNETSLEDENYLALAIYTTKAPNLSSAI
ncbi:MAG: leucine-rich repeat protein [Candidatus Onthovivens sp.]|nr:leucine-rich repeat protein [Candidatus Onthovivens sp.]